MLSVLTSTIDISAVSANTQAPGAKARFQSGAGSVPKQLIVAPLFLIVANGVETKSSTSTTNCPLGETFPLSSVATTLIVYTIAVPEPLQTLAELTSE